MASILSSSSTSLPELVSRGRPLARASSPRSQSTPLSPSEPDALDHVHSSPTLNHPRLGSSSSTQLTPSSTSSRSAPCTPTKPISQQDEACFVDPPFPSPMPLKRSLSFSDSHNGLDDTEQSSSVDLHSSYRSHSPLLQPFATRSAQARSSSKELRKVDFLSYLPTEIALYILLGIGTNQIRSLVRCRLVSKNWRRLAEDPVVWHEMFKSQPTWLVKNEFRIPSPPPCPSSARLGRLNGRLSQHLIPLAEVAEEVECSSNTITPPLSQPSSSSDQAPLETNLPQATHIPSAQPVSNLISPTGARLISDLISLTPPPRSLSRENSFDSYPSNPSGNRVIARRLSQLLGDVTSLAITSPSRRLSASADLQERRTSVNDSSATPPSRRPYSYPPALITHQISSRSSDPQALVSPCDTLHNLHDAFSGSSREIEEEFQESSSLDWFQLFRDRYVIETRWREGQQTTKTLRGHKDSVYCLQFDHSKIVTGSRDRSVKVWDMKTGACTKTLKGHQGSVLCVRFEGERTLWTGSSDCKIIGWDMYTGMILHEFLGHTSGVLDLALTSRWIVSCSKDTSIRLWPRSGGVEGRTIAGHTGPVNALELAPYGQMLSASGDSTMKLWDLETGVCLRTFEGHLRGLACIKLVEPMGWVISGSNDETIKVWDLRTGQCLRTLLGHEGLVRTLDVDVKERRLVSGSYDKTIKVWDFETGEMKLDFRKGQKSIVFDVSIDFGKVVSVGHDSNITILDFTDGIDIGNFL